MINHQSTNSTLTNSDNPISYSIEMNASMFAMLTKDVYNDPIKAVIREWSTNAIDACIAANKPVSYDVQLPTLEDPVFSVRDYGTGLAKEDIEGLFSALGASTKRNSNDFNGTFGIGRLAGLACSDTFTVRSYYNGRCYTYVTTVVDGIPTSLFLDDESTTEPNGLHLSIPVDLPSVSTFKNRAQSLYTYFQDNQKPNLNLDLDIYRDSSKDISSEWFFDTSDFTSRYSNYVIMSNVLYQIPENSELSTYNLRGVVLKVPTGAVSINPGRESISLSKTSIDYLNSRFKDISENIIQNFTDLVNAQPTNLQKIQEYAKNFKLIPGTILYNANLRLPDFLSSEYQDAGQTSYYTPIYDTKSFLTTFPNTIIHKKRRYKTNSEPALNLPDLLSENYLILDLKTNFKDIVTSFNDAVVLRPRDVKKMDAFLQEAPKVIKSLGVTEYVYASSLVETIEKSPKVSRKGIYVCPIQTAHTIEKSIKEDSCKEYWYIELNKMEPTIDRTELADLLTLYYRIPNAKPLVGVQKRYLKAVQESGRYTPAKQQILNYIKAQDNIVHSADLVLIARNFDDFLDHHTIPHFPAEVRELKVKVKSFLEQRTEFTSYLDSHKEMLDTYNIPYIVVDTPITYHDFILKYPAFHHLSDLYHPSGELVTYMLNRELHYIKTKGP